MSKKKNLDHTWFFLSNFCSFLIELCAILAQFQSTLGLYLVHIFTQIRQKTSHFKLNVKNQIKTDSLLLSEIIVTVKNKNEIQLKYDKIVQSINSIGFKETAIKFSISDSKNNSGLLGWVNINSLSEKIKNEIKNLKIGDITKPILVSSGIMILKLEDKKFIEPNQNIEIQLEKLINFEMNNQLNNFSSIFYNKIKKDIIINEY